MKHQPFSVQVSNARVCVLMVHGILGTPHHFDMLLPHVPEDWDVHSIMLDGHGGTLHEFACSSREKWETQVRDEIAYVCQRYERVIVVAHSMGCMLSANATVSLGLEHKIAAMLFLGAALYPKCDLPIVKTAIRMIKCKPGNEDDAMVAARACCSVDVYKISLWEFLSSAPRFWDLFAIARYTRKRISAYHLPIIALQSYKDEVVGRRSIKPFLKNPYAKAEFLTQSSHFYYAPTDLQRICTVFCDIVQDVNKNPQKVSGS